MFITKLKKLTIAISIVTMLSQQVQAGNFVDEVMDGVLGDLTNVTQPDIYSAANRGNLALGSIYMRTKIFDPKIVSFAPPSFRGGCGGIDFFGGSFSFINSDQLVQLFRSIAANAVGLLFMMALDIVCPDCAGWIQRFQTMIREINSYLADSCQMAQGILTHTREIFDSNRQNQATMSNQSSGLGDNYEAKTNSFGGLNTGSPSDTAEQTDAAQASENNLFGNIVWKAFKRSSLANSYIYSGDDIGEILMSITGSVIIGKSEQKTTNDNTVDSYNPVQYLQPLLDLQTFIEGSDIKKNASKYKCVDGVTDAECIDVIIEDAYIEGFAQKLYNGLCGTSNLMESCEGGLVYKLATNNSGTGADLTDAEKNILTSVGIIASDIVPLSVAGASENYPTSIVSNFIQSNIRAIALFVVNNTINDMYKSIEQVITKEKGANAEHMIKTLKDNRQLLNQEYQRLVKEYGDINSIREQSQKIKQNFVKGKKFNIGNSILVKSGE